MSYVDLVLLWVKIYIFLKIEMILRKFGIWRHFFTKIGNVEILELAVLDEGWVFIGLGWRVEGAVIASLSTPFSQLIGRCLRELIKLEKE